MEQLYLSINLAILAGPLALSFDRRVAFFTHWPKLGVSLAVVSTAYLAWDAIATAAGHWSFNPDYSGTLTVAGLPVGEILFFITVPYACLFIYEVVRGYFAERRHNRIFLVRLLGGIVAAGFIAAAFLFRNRGYTCAAFSSVAVMIVATILLDPVIWCSSHTLLFIAISFIPFFIANGVLTSLPIVSYGEEAILGVRVLSIPLEDFFYNVGMLGFYLLVYRFAGRLFRKTGSRQ